MKRCVGWATLGVGLLLLGGAVLGEFTVLGNYPSAVARKWEAFNPSLVSELQSYSALLSEAQRRIGDRREQLMLVLYNLVSERFSHSDSASYNFFSNWLLAGLGAIHPAFKHIRVPETMVSQGHSLLCDQSSYLLLRLAMDNGVRARHVGLNGHVVMEAWYDEDWHLFDPDLEVVPRDGEGEVLSVEELAQTPPLLREYYGDHQGENASMVEILGSREDNTYMSYPPGAWFEWKTNALFWFERLAGYLKFVIPIFLMAVGGWMVGHARKVEKLKGKAA